MAKGRNVSVDQAPLGVLLQEAQKRWDEKHAALMRCGNLLDVILSSIDEGNVEGIKNLRGMIQDAVVAAGIKSLPEMMKDAVDGTKTM